MQKKIILLFYNEYEADKFVKYDRYLKRVLRPIYKLFHHRQKKSGFAVSFELMCRALRNAGYDVRVNDYHFAKRNPTHPVGIVGFPLLLDSWTLPNPAILGPSLYDHPMLCPNLLADRRFQRYAVLADWTYDMFAPVYGEACFRWFAGIDLQKWPDLCAFNKEYDFLVYDKIRWDHDAFDVALIQPILERLKKGGMRYTVVRYKMYDHAAYKKLLEKSKAIIFLCEHETQGIAYQEAMASGLPVLAWDRGFWADPLWKKFSDKPPSASSVPFFSKICGETFATLTEFDRLLPEFIEKLPMYQPRKYVEQNLSMKDSARIYADQYFSLLS